MTHAELSLKSHNKLDLCAKFGCQVCNSQLINMEAEIVSNVIENCLKRLADGHGSIMLLLFILLWNRARGTHESK